LRRSRANGPCRTSVLRRARHLGASCSRCCARPESRAKSAVVLQRHARRAARSGVACADAVCLPAYPAELAASRALGESGDGQAPTEVRATHWLRSKRRSARRLTLFGPRMSAQPPTPPRSRLRWPPRSLPAWQQQATASAWRLRPPTRRAGRDACGAAPPSSSATATLRAAPVPRRDAPASRGYAGRRNLPHPLRLRSLRLGGFKSQHLSRSIIACGNLAKARLSSTWRTLNRTCKSAASRTSGDALQPPLQLVPVQRPRLVRAVAQRALRYCCASLRLHTSHRPALRLLKLCRVQSHHAGGDNALSRRFANGNLGTNGQLRRFDA